MFNLPAPTIKQSPLSLHNPDMRFAPAMETAFQQDYYLKSLPGLRLGFLLVTVLHAALAILDVEHFGTLNISTWLTPITGLVLIGLTLHPRFGAIWQPCIVVLFSTLAFLILSHVAGGPLHPPPHGSRVPVVTDSRTAMNFLMIRELWFIILGFLMTRLRFWWFVLGCVVVGLMTVVIAAEIARIPLTEIATGSAISIVIPVAVLMFMAYARERGARAEFLANYLLAQERADERRQRERTEAMLRVLSQAIGGIVHDLGNPLTAVQTGASTLMMFARRENLDQETTIEFAQIISNGAQMLNYLRLSLMEQTRVLEGKPIPLERKAVGIRQVIEAGAQYQQPRLLSGHKISIVGDNQDAWIDEMKMITVFMNLIGNALKYSDGEVLATWQTHEDYLIAAVLDRGKQGTGITHPQAQQLFVPFGRLEAHASVEGTGLGLLSAQKIVAAHGGEIFIEGYTEGSATSRAFSTAQNAYPSMLTPNFCTAFVVTCPFA